ncbi:hypothetical protein [Sphingomonas sp. PAMC 26605]|uniref:hypothetical protein n=1 Tax=Sphingomonas sp. PAMC 26605 TaxID=1112214 RepID=UPI00026CCB89|nr:hypothetical protein [Sphingomonas sp. PAMC 26605]
MALRFDLIKEQILIVLYDYMLTADDEAFWYSVPSIREALSPDVSGAFAKRAIDALVEEGSLEEGLSDPPGEPKDTITFALTEEGIQSAERVLVRKGWDLADYQPAPDVDRIISRSEEPDLHAMIHDQIRDLATGLSQSNEAGDVLGDHKDLITDELNSAADISSKERFRLQRLTAFLLPTLQFIASKFFGGAIGEAAKQLATLLMKLP